MNKDPDRRPPADSSPPSAQAPAPPALEDSPKAEGPALGPTEDLPLYTIENLEAWARELRSYGTAFRLTHEPPLIEALDNAARFMEDTVGTLRRQRDAARRRKANSVIRSKRGRSRRRQR